MTLLLTDPQRAELKNRVQQAQNGNQSALNSFVREHGKAIMADFVQHHAVAKALQPNNEEKRLGLLFTLLTADAKTVNLFTETVADRVKVEDGPELFGLERVKAAFRKQLEKQKL